jgi:hypothetical protein
LIGFKLELAGRLNSANNEFIKIQKNLQEKRSDDSFIMKGEMESLEEEYHKIGDKINLLGKIRDKIFKKN